MAAPRRVEVPSYGEVLDRVERRLYRIDRYRLPNPGGVPLRALGYGIGCLALLALLRGLPLLGALIGALPFTVAWVALPLAVGWLLTVWRVDGRAPHRALRSLARHLCGPRTYSALRPCPRVGSVQAPVGELASVALGDGPHYRPGRVAGPARLILRYPVRARPRGRRGRGTNERLRRARRVELYRLPGAGVLAEAKVLRVPAGRAVTFR